MSAFADALHEFVQASNAYAGHRWATPHVRAEEEAAQRLAQAGDVLEAR